MHVINLKPIRAFLAQGHKDARDPLLAWYKKASKTKWSNLAEVRADYPHCDMYGSCYIFNIGGNKYRLIVKIEFLKGTIYVKHVLTHKEYDKDSWKNDC